jgi:hypothetical protein
VPTTHEGSLRTILRPFVGRNDPSWVDGTENVWGYNPVYDDRSDFTQSRPLQGYLAHEKHPPP